jgi:hypothetical protein
MSESPAGQKAEGRRQKAGEAVSPHPPLPSTRPDCLLPTAFCLLARRAGPVVAWTAAVFCGWRVTGGWGLGSAAPEGAPPAGWSGDLLDAVLRGAAAWLGVLVIWTAGITACERCLDAWRAARPVERSDTLDGTS